jgi:hypothetical protein
MEYIAGGPPMPSNGHVGMSVSSGDAAYSASSGTDLVPQFADRFESFQEIYKNPLAGVINSAPPCSNSFRFGKFSPTDLLVMVKYKRKYPLFVASCSLITANQVKLCSDDAFIATLVVISPEGLNMSTERHELNEFDGYRIVYMVNRTAMQFCSTETVFLGRLAMWVDKSKPRATRFNTAALGPSFKAVRNADSTSRNLVFTAGHLFTDNTGNITSQTGETVVVYGDSEAPDVRLTLTGM